MISKREQNQKLFYTLEMIITCKIYNKQQKKDRIGSKNIFEFELNTG